jgi:hypothetical protein
VAQWLIDYFDLELQDAGEYAARLNFAPDRVRVAGILGRGPRAEAH